MSRLWSDLVGKLTPYVPGEQPRQQRLIKLNTNENPYPPAPGVLQALAAVNADSLRRYPDPESTALCESLAALHGLQPEQVFIGNGSDEVLAHVFQALLRHSEPLLFPDISYSFYPVWAQLYDIACETVPLADDFSVRVEDYRRPNGGIIIPNPNAPTGVLLPLSGIRALLQANPDSVVVVDEAYIDFGGASATALIDEHDNLLVVQTLSKSRSLAGLRVGFALGNAALIEGLSRVKNSFNSYPLGAVAQQVALAALADDNYFRNCCQRVIATRETLSIGLEQLGFEVLPSAANFVFARHPRWQAQVLFEALREQGIIVRHFQRPRIDEFLRISVGTEADTQALLQALESLIQG